MKQRKAEGRVKLAAELGICLLDVRTQQEQGLRISM